MGGEFFLTMQPGTTIDQDLWTAVLKSITMDIEELGEFRRDSGKYAFEYVDPAFRGKYFRVAWEWGQDAIANGLGGRQRSDWSHVRLFCERLCDSFKGKFALVVSDGFSGYDDDAGTLYYDGIGKSYKETNYKYWPWTSIMPPVEMVEEKSTARIGELGSPLNSLTETDIGTTAQAHKVEALRIGKIFKENHQQHNILSWKYMCSFCYVLLEKPLQCGKCKKKPYCSRPCQVADWKLHKVWCGRVAELNIDFEIKESNGRGKGIFAKRPFERGEKILTERPVIRVESAQDFNTIKQQFDAQVPSIQYAIESLIPIGIGKGLEKIISKGVLGCKRNIMDLGGIGCGLFIIASRLNHDCLPNCARRFVDDHGVLVISAGKDIAAGEELTIAYTDLLKFSFGREAFLDYMRTGWDFTCSCRACQDDKIFNKLKSLSLMDDKILMLAATGEFNKAFKTGQKMIHLYDELQLTPDAYSRTYYDMFQMSVVQKKTLAIAKDCALKSLKCLEECIGGGKTEPKELRKARECALNPERHRNYLLLD